MIQIHHQLSIILAMSMVSTLVMSEPYIYEYEDDFSGEPVSDSGNEIVRLSDLQQDANKAAELDIPIVIVFGTSWCEYCHFLEQEVLEPMLLGMSDSPQAIFRKVVSDEYGKFLDIDGSRQYIGILEERYGIDLFPTLVFLDGQARDLGFRIVGVGTFDFIGENINQAIRQSRERLLACRSNQSDCVSDTVEQPTL